MTDIQLTDNVRRQIRNFEYFEFSAESETENRFETESNLKRKSRKLSQARHEFEKFENFDKSDLIDKEFGVKLRGKSGEKSDFERQNK